MDVSKMRAIATLFLLGGVLTSQTAVAEGLYTGFGVGQAYLEEDDGPVDLDTDSTGIRVWTGYEINQNFSIELGYTTAQDFEDTVLGVDVEAEYQILNFAVLGTLPLSDSVSAYGKLGFYDGEQEVSVGNVNVEDDIDGAMYGAGLRIKTGGSLAFRLEFEKYDTDFDSVTSAMVGIEFGF
jgi:hypothetical protein